jgi:hypothetical protein
VAIRDKITQNNVNICLGRATVVDIRKLELLRTSVDIWSLKDLWQKVGEMYEICIEERWVCE